MLGLITILLATILSPLCAFAGPPVLTDDTGTPGAGKWEINVGFSIDKRTAGDRYEARMIDINYGLGDHIQLKYEAPWIFLDSREVGSKNGPGNSTMGVKWRFLDEDKHGLAMSVYPQVELNNPTSSADRGIVDKGNIYFFPVQMEKKIGPVNVNIEFGRAFHQHGEDEWIYGLVFGHKILANLEGLVEMHGGAKRGFKQHEVVYNLGFRLDFSETFGMQASAGRGLHNAPDQPNLLLYAGVQFRLGK